MRFSFFSNEIVMKSLSECDGKRKRTRDKNTMDITRTSIFSDVSSFQFINK